MNKDSRNSGGAYLPERYRQQIEAKKRRRIIKKITGMVAVIAFVAIVYGLLSGSLVPPSSKNLKPLPVTTDSFGGILSAPAPSSIALTGNMTVGSPTLTGSDIPPGLPDGMISSDDAMVLLRRDYPEAAYSLIGVNLTDQSGNSSVYEFRIRRTESSPVDPGFPVFYDAFSGDPYIPGQEGAGISPERVKNLVREIFTFPGSDKIRVKYDTGPDPVRAWFFEVYRGNSSFMSGSLDPDTGQIISFSRRISETGRPSDRSLSITAAQEIADRYIIERNGAPLPVNMSESRYEQLGSGEAGAGHYVFTYTRIVQNIPCDYDGFTISVDSVTGEITGYNRRWFSPDNAFSVAVDSPVKKYEAVFSIQTRAQETFPDSTTGLKIISAEIRWKDRHPLGVLPRPGSITAAWKIQFDDDIIRSQEWLSPATGWVDGRTGKVLEIDYHH